MNAKLLWLKYQKQILCCTFYALIKKRELTNTCQVNRVNLTAFFVN